MLWISLDSPPPSSQSATAYYANFQSILTVECVLLVFDLLLNISAGFLSDEGNKIFHALWSKQEVHQFVVLSLALLQDIIFIHHLQQCDIFLFQQRVDVGCGMEVKFPKHLDSKCANMNGSMTLEKKTASSIQRCTGLLLPTSR